ncbi:MAG: HEAT repeat domain-containing protein [Saprospiraceae bacterium]
MMGSEKDKLVAYLLGELSTAESNEVEQKIAGSPALQQEVQELKLVLGLFDQQEEVETSVYQRDRFYEFLELEAGQQNRNTPAAARISWRAAAAVAILAIGLGFGVIWTNHSRQQEQILSLSKEVVETRKLLLLAMMDEASASERIQAMNVSMQEAEPDQRVLDALIDRLHNDENVNVRLKAAESIGRFMQYPGVADAAIQAMELEDSPEIQITLIESLTNSLRKEAVPSFRRLLKREDVPEVVRDVAAFGLETMI